ncbi:glycoside hydrolase family protein [uncultured Bacteroides sp.]|uniref:glycoside hydrolase family protein n=1 Tax=uncultured Bacteroides sp. TaxID=162156 RepID=UPI002AAC1FD0|nr:glycoside hydrolase family protein [uncultured Bacteroides sp.]
MKVLTFYVFLLFLCLPSVCFSQVAERERPQEWKHLVKGSRFIDRFLPMKGNDLSADTWGAKGVIPRYVDNGIEDRIWSYWGGNIIKGEDGKYHLFVCGWLESSPKGHSEWPRSIVFNAVSDNTTGPFVLRSMIGKGHNPEAFRLKDGRYVIYVIDGRYVSDHINGPWEYGKFEFNARDRAIIEGLSNLSFAQREDGSYIMVCRGGGIWISQTGLSEYNQITDKRVYPDVDGRFEDPVIWRDSIQYHMIVNDWLGRIAYYLRSKDGINWVTDPGEAYAPGVAVHQDGKKEDWFKYERLKIYQDAYGRAIQANFAVIDTLKAADKPWDNHSSKNISIPLNPGLLLTMLDDAPITKSTKTIRLLIRAEKGFNPLTDIDLESLRFGASSEVNFGRGCKVLKTEPKGKDLIVTFDAKGNGITKDEFAPKLIGKKKSGDMLYGYARLPYVNYVEPILSARAPHFQLENARQYCSIEVQNFGQVASFAVQLKIEMVKMGKKKQIVSGKVPALKPYEKRELRFSCKKLAEGDLNNEFIVTIYSKGKVLSVFTVKAKAKS